jgi:hypothetical protein
MRPNLAMPPLRHRLAQRPRHPRRVWKSILASSLIIVEAESIRRRELKVLGHGSPTTYSSSRVIFNSTAPLTAGFARYAFSPAYSISRVLSVLHNIQYLFMALSILNAPLPALNDWIALTPHRSSFKKINSRLAHDTRISLGVW